MPCASAVSLLQWLLVQDFWMARACSELRKSADSGAACQTGLYIHISILLTLSLTRIDVFLASKVETEKNWRGSSSYSELKRLWLFLHSHHCYLSCLRGLTGLSKALRTQTLALWITYVPVECSLCLSKWLLATYSSLCFSQNMLLTQAFISVVMNELCLSSSLIVWHDIALLPLLGSSEVTSFCPNQDNAFCAYL